MTVSVPGATMTSLPSVPVMVPVEPSIVAGWPWQTAAAAYVGATGPVSRDRGRYDDGGGQCGT